MIVDHATLAARAIQQMLTTGATEEDIASYLRDAFVDERRAQMDEIQSFADWRKRTGASGK